MLCSNNIKLQCYLQDCRAFNFLIISTVGVSAQFRQRHFYLFSWLTSGIPVAVTYNRASHFHTSGHCGKSQVGAGGNPVFPPHTPLPGPKLLYCYLPDTLDKGSSVLKN